MKHVKRRKCAKPKSENKAEFDWGQLMRPLVAIVLGYGLLDEIWPGKYGSTHFPLPIEKPGTKKRKSKAKRA